MPDESSMKIDLFPYSGWVILFLKTLKRHNFLKILDITKALITS